MGALFYISLFFWPVKQQRSRQGIIVAYSDIRPCASKIPSVQRCRPEEKCMAYSLCSTRYWGLPHIARLGRCLLLCIFLHAAQGERLGFAIPRTYKKRLPVVLPACFSHTHRTSCAPTYRHKANAFILTACHMHLSMGTRLYSCSRGKTQHGWLHSPVSCEQGLLWCGHTYLGGTTSFQIPSGCGYLSLREPAAPTISCCNRYYFSPAVAHFACDISAPNGDDLKTFPP